MSRKRKTSRLLVSVRSAQEARLAVRGGATIIDVKEPSLGSLGRASADIWRAVRDAVPRSLPVSVALGELTDWDPDLELDWTGVAFAKIGLARAGPDWIDRWRQLADKLGNHTSASFSWVAVSYIDWRGACSPDPETVIDVAASLPNCQGVLFDTWDKSSAERIDLGWSSCVSRAKTLGLFVAVAGSLDSSRIEKLAELKPDIWAVRGAACVGGQRDALIDPDRVARLADLVRHLSSQSV